MCVFIEQSDTSRKVASFLHIALQCQYEEKPSTFVKSFRNTWVLNTILSFYGLSEGWGLCSFFLCGSFFLRFVTKWYFSFSQIQWYFRFKKQTHKKARRSRAELAVALVILTALTPLFISFSQRNSVFISWFHRTFCLVSHTGDCPDRILVSMVWRMWRLVHCKCLTPLSFWQLRAHFKNWGTVSMV